MKNISDIISKMECDAVQLLENNSGEQTIRIKELNDDLFVFLDLEFTYDCNYEPETRDTPASLEPELINVYINKSFILEENEEINIYNIILGEIKNLYSKNVSVV